MMNTNTHRFRPLVLPTSVSAQTFWITTFAFLTAIGAQIEIPRQPVPFTLQTLFVMLAGGALGARGGFLSMAMYLIVGLAGLPVFSGMGFGLAKILGPTGGYLLSFPLAAGAIGYLTSRRSEFWWTALSMTAGLLIIFTLGTVHLYATFIHSWQEAFSSGFLLFSMWDVAKLVSATALLHAWRWKRS